MALTTESLAILRSYCGKFGDCSLVEGRNAIELVVRKTNLRITITVPIDVHEWYVDVKEGGTALEARDWYDYAGYESSDDKDLDRDMAEDLRLFLENISANPLRMRNADPKKRHVAILEWQVDGSWQQAVPFTAR
jgi:hypothetical protein